MLSFLLVLLTRFGLGLQPAVFVACTALRTKDVVATRLASRTGHRFTEAARTQATVTCTEVMAVGDNTGRILATNVFERQGGQWKVRRGTRKGRSWVLGWGLKLRLAAGMQVASGSYACVAIAGIPPMEGATSRAHGFARLSRCPACRK